MRTCILIVAILFILAFGSLIQASSLYNTELKADKEFLEKQKRVYQLLWHVNQPHVVNSQLYEEGQTFKLEENLSSFHKSPVNDIEFYS